MYEDRVRRGAELLDRARPGWAAEIANKELDMMKCDEFVLGRIYGDYEVGWRTVLRDLSPSVLFSSAAHGFTLFAGEQEIVEGTDGDDLSDIAPTSDTLGRFAALADAWRAEIRARAGDGSGVANHA